MIKVKPLTNKKNLINNSKNILSLPIFGYSMILYYICKASNIIKIEKELLTSPSIIKTSHRIMTKNQKSLFLIVGICFIMYYLVILYYLL